MKRLVILLLFLTIFFSSCVRLPKVEDTNFSDLTNAQKELLIRLIATGYNQGADSRSFEDLKNLSNNISYDDNVLYNYNYFIGKNTALPTREVSTKATSSEDERIKVYVNNVIDEISQNKSNSNFFINSFDSEIPINPKEQDKNFKYLNPQIITNYDKRNILVEKVYNLIKRDYELDYTFYKWYDKFFSRDLVFSDKEILEYSEYLVDIVYAYTNSNIVLNNNSTINDNFPREIQLNHIPVELLLSIIYQESKFFPGSFRAEISNSNIYALSFGLTHVLIDADFLYISSKNVDIGNNKKELYRFSLISWHYLFNKMINGEVEETYFSDWDLITVRGSILYSAIYLDMIYQKLIKYIK